MTTPSLPNIIIVNGERDWASWFPDARVRFCRLEQSQWVLQGGRLSVLAEGELTRIDGVLWRVGAIRPDPLHRAVLDLIRLAGIPCVNPARTLQLGFDRLSMQAEMKAIGIPQLEQTVVIGQRLLDRTTPSFPAVIKIGNYHAGYGKAHVDTLNGWADLRDIAFTAHNYVSLEPYIEYQRDIRCLAVGDEIWAMERRSSTWKANRDTDEATLISAPPELVEYTKRAMDHLGADILGLDFLETEQGEFYLLENNDVPGLTGFPDFVRRLLAELLMTQVNG